MRRISKDIWMLFWTQFFGALNDNVFKNSLIILITYQGISVFGMNSSMLVALAGGIFILPFFFLSAISGQIADRFEKTKLVLIIKKIEVLIVLISFYGFFTNNYKMLLFVLFLFGLHSTFFGPLKYSLIPHYAKKEDLVFSNALISSGTFVAILLGTILGGISASSNQQLWLLKILLILISLLGFLAASKLTPTTKLEEIEIMNHESRIDWNFYSSSKEILKLVFKNSRVGILIIGISWFWFLGAGLLSLLPLLSKNIYQGKESVATLMLFIFTLGMGVGPFVYEKISKGKVVRFMIPVSLILMSFFIFDISLILLKLEKLILDGKFLSTTNLQGISGFLSTKKSIRLLVDLFMLSFFGGIFTVSQFSDLQHVSSNKELSRIVAGNNILNALFMVTVSIGLMFLHQFKFSLMYIFGILGGLNILMCLILVFYYKEEFNKFWRF